MYCPYCRQPVVFSEKEYVKIVRLIGSETFYHINCFYNLTGVQVRPFNSTVKNPLLSPMTSMGEEA